MADFLVVVHFLFILFVVLGAFLVLKWWKLVFIHVPAVVWGALIEFQDRVCPLTPLEQRLRLSAGEEGYRGSFVQHYLLPVIYPEALTRELQTALGVFVVFINLAAYGWILIRMRQNKMG